MRGGEVQMAKIGVRVPEENKEILAEIAKQTDQTIQNKIRANTASPI